MLPDADVAWPPKHFEPFFALASVYDGWYSGNLSATATEVPAALSHRTQYNGGVVGSVSRAILGAPSVAAPTHRLHIPLAADIATLSADYLFGEAPRVVFPGQRKADDAERTDEEKRRDEIQDRCEKIINTARFHSTLLEAGEIGAALGGVYLRLVWDKARLKAVSAEAVHADAAIPSFRYGVLDSVIFWTELPADPKTPGVVYRHLEEHRSGEIEHGLYAGTSDKLGRSVPFEDRPETQWLVPENGPALVDDRRVMQTGVTGLTAAYVPNMRPNSQFRKTPGLQMLGQSDYAHITQLFSAIDEVWSSWMRDIRVAKARIIVAKSMLQGHGFGGGASFDFDREVYEGIDAITGPDGKSLGIHAEQFQIRHAEHSATVKELREQAMRSAGWTPASAGGQGSGVRTATEITADERLSERTRDKKSNYWRTLTPFFFTWMELDAKLYETAVPTEDPEFRFPSESQVDLEKMARTTSLMRGADAISVETSVRMHHPEWDGETVNQEVARIYQEKGYAPIADPTLTTSLPTDPTPEELAAMRAELEAAALRANASE